MSDRPKLKLKTGPGAARDPRRKPVRALTAPHRPKPPDEPRHDSPQRPRRSAPAGAPGRRGEAERQPHSDRRAPPRDDRRPVRRDASMGSRPPRDDRGAASATDRPRADRGDARNRAPARPERPPRAGRPGEHPRAPQRGRPEPRPARTERRDERPARPPADRAGPAPRRATGRDDARVTIPAPRRSPPAAPRTAPPGAPDRPRREPVATSDGIRLSKRLTEDGVASRREADAWIEAGWVRVDGRVARLGQRVQPGQRIDIDPAARREQAQRVTILLHKPVGVVSGQAEDGYEPAAVLVTRENHWAEDPTRIAFHPGHTRGLAPAGRLDIDSTGLLVLTQDGRIAKALIGEDSAVEKEYLVRVESATGAALADVDLGRLRHGLELDGQPLKPARVSWANEDQLRFVLREGRKRQIRRMCEAVGLTVLGLKRVRIGRIPLGRLPPGQWRYLGPFERF